MKEIMDLRKTTQTSQIKCESHLNHIQKSADYITVRFDKYEKNKKEKEKNSMLEDKKNS